MKYTETEIEGVWLIEPRVFNDARGSQANRGDGQVP